MEMLAIPLSDENFGDWLRARRLASGMSLRDAARKVGVSATAFQKWESGAIRPRANKLEGLTRLFDMIGQDNQPVEKAAVGRHVAARRAARKPAPEVGGEENLRTHIELSKRSIASAAGISPDRVKIVIEY